MFMGMKERKNAVLLFICFYVVCSNCFAQNITSQRVSKYELAKLVYYIGEFDTTQFFLKDKFGEEREIKIKSACIAPAPQSFEGCGCSDFLYISIVSGAHPEFPDNVLLYKIGPFFQPKLIASTKKKNSITMKIEFGHNAIQTKLVMITNDNVVLK
jgi:hypothetical protein